MWVGREQVVRRQPSAKYVRVFFVMQLPGFAAPYLRFPPDFSSVRPTTRLCSSDGQMKQWAAALEGNEGANRETDLHVHLDVDLLKSHLIEAVTMRNPILWLIATKCD